MVFVLKHGMKTLKICINLRVYTKTSTKTNCSQIGHIMYLFLEKTFINYYKPQVQKKKERRKTQ